MKIGILGGTFDPIHEGHLAIAEHVLKTFHLDRIDFIPCFQPPHRDQPAASPDHRYVMVQLAIENSTYFRVDDIEILRGNISYTIDTVTALQQQFPDNQYYIILGADAFAQFDTWHDWEKIMVLCDIIVVNRNKKTIEIPEKIAAFQKNKLTQKQIYFCTITPIPFSATQIRADIQAKKEKIPGLTTAVQDYIVKQQVY